MHEICIPHMIPHVYGNRKKGEAIRKNRHKNNSKRGVINLKKKRTCMGTKSKKSQKSPN